MKPIDPSSVDTTHPIAADGGITTPPPIEREAYAILDDLMLLIEELCPVWPQRPAYTDSGEWKL